MLLSEFTIEQLIQELIDRPQFAGIVAYSLRGKAGQMPKAGDKASLSTSLKWADAKILLESILRLPLFGGEG